MRAAHRVARRRWPARRPPRPPAACREAGTGDGPARVHARRSPRAPAGARRAGARDLGRLEGQDRVRALAAGGHEQVVEVLDGGLRVERHDRVLELLGADRPRSGCATPGAASRRPRTRPARRRRRRPSSAGRPGPRLVLGHQQPRGADEVGLGVADRGHVELVAADDRERRCRATPAAGRCPRGCRAACGWRSGRLLEADRDARRLVVVVLAPDRRRRPARSPRAAAPAARADG